jgi:hypothetical protein
MNTLYAIETNGEFVARRGFDVWLQEKATGWALFGKYEDAREFAEYATSSYNPIFTEYAIIQIKNT